MTTADIRQHEAGALTFGRETYGDDLADAMYLGTFNSIHYFGPVFYDFRISKNIESFFIIWAAGEYRFMSANKFELSSDKDRRDFERRQHIWWDMIGSIQCAYERGRRHPQDHQQDSQRYHFRQRLAPFLTKTLNPG